MLYSSCFNLYYITNVPFSQFRKFKSTLNRLQPPENFDNPHVLHDPRFKDQEGPDTPRVYYPYPAYDSDEWRNTHRGSFSACMGPRGLYLNESLEDQVGVYIGTPTGMYHYTPYLLDVLALTSAVLGFPKPIFGSYEALGLDSRLSFDRYTRYGPYGFGEQESSVNNWIKPSKVNWDDVDWGLLQRQCVERNADRYARTEEDADDSFPEGVRNFHIPPEPRTVVLIRTYTGKTYSENDKHLIRSLVTELSLQTGGEYDVVLLTHVRDNEIPIENDDIYQQVLEEHIPKEFWGITKLWTVPIVAARYPLLDPSVVE